MIKKGIISGFTLIELLVVVSLIGILATLVVSNLNAARQRGRDAQRKSDLRNTQTALGIYYGDCGVFPANSGDTIQGCGTCGTPTVCSWGDPFSTDIQTYMAKLPTEPLPGGFYNYVRVDLDSYTLRACLENTSDTAGFDDPAASWCSTKWIYEVAQ